MAGTLEIQPHLMAEAKGLASRISSLIPDTLSTLPSVAKEKALPWVFRGALATGTALTGTAGIDHVSTLRPHVASAQDTQGEIAMVDTEAKGNVPEVYVEYSSGNPDLPYSAIFPFGWTITTEMQNGRPVDAITGDTIQGITSKGEIMILPELIDPETGTAPTVEGYDDAALAPFLAAGGEVAGQSENTIDGFPSREFTVKMPRASDMDPRVNVAVFYFKAQNPATGKEDVWLMTFSSADGQQILGFYKSVDKFDAYKDNSSPR